MMKTFVSLK